MTKNRPMELKAMKPRDPLETKATSCFQTKVTDEAKGIVEHLITVFGIVDLGGDVSHPGVFKRSLKERGDKIRVLDAHNRASVNSVLGYPLLIKEIGRGALPADVRNKYPEATGGLWARTQFLLETPEGKGAFDRIRAGAVDEFSYGFDAIKVSSGKRKVDGREIAIRNLHEVRLWEYSPVVNGMNQATAVMDVKGAGGLTNAPPVGKARAAVSLTQLLVDVEEAFKEAFTGSEGRNSYYVNEVLDKHLVAYEYSQWGSKRYYQVGYKVSEDEGITFAPLDKWKSGRYLFHLDEAKTALLEDAATKERVRQSRIRLIEIEELMQKSQGD